MTYAPDDLLAIRRYVLTKTGLPGDAVGIAGDPDHVSTGGYHEGNDDLSRVGRLNSDYSKRESSRDRPGTNGASALDIGDFSRGGITLRSMTLAFVSACQRGDRRTADVREVIYTPDGKTVHRFDRLGIRSTGDSSHLWHTHISFFRDSEGRRARPDNVLGLLVEIFEGVDMAAFLEDRDAAAMAWRIAAMQGGNESVPGGPVAGEPMRIVQDVHRISTAVEEVKADVAALKARPTDTVTLTPEDRAAIVADLVKALGPITEQAAEAAVRHVLGGLDGGTPPNK